MDQTNIFILSTLDSIIAIESQLDNSGNGKLLVMEYRAFVTSVVDLFRYLDSGISNLLITDYKITTPIIFFTFTIK